MRELVLNVKHENWSCIGPGEWINTEWKIYQDQTADIVITYDSIKEKRIKINNCKLTQANYNKLFKKIKRSKKIDIEIDGCDGCAWEITQYNNGKKIWKREMDYIYDIKPLEEIAQILNKLIQVSEEEIIARVELDKL